MKRLLSSVTLALAAMLLMLGFPTQTLATSQTTDFDHANDDDALVSFDGPADLAAVNAEVFIYAYSAGANRTDGIDRTQTVDGNSTTETAGPLSARTRAQTSAGNGITENEKGLSNQSALPHLGLVTGLNYGIVRATYDRALKLDRSPLMAPNSEYRHLALKSGNNVVNVNLTSFRTDRPTTVQLR